MSSIAQEKFATGNRVKLYARGDGQKTLLGEGFVGRMPNAQSFRANIDTGAQEVYGIGTPAPIGIVDTRHQFRVSLSMVQFTDAKCLEKAKAEPIDIDAVDAFSDTRMATAQECHFGGGSLSINANQPVMGEMNFVCMNVVSA